MDRHPLHSHVDFCALISGFVYMTDCSDEVITNKLQKVKKSFSIVKYERTPIGCLGVLDSDENNLYIAFQGTCARNISQLLIDGTIAIMGGGDTKQQDEFKTSMFSIRQYADIVQSLIDYAKRNGGEGLGRDLLQSFAARAIMFAQKLIETCGNVKQIVTTGHSLGGMYAQLVSNALLCDVITFAAPGTVNFDKLATENMDFYFSVKKREEPRRLHLCTSDDVLGRYGKHLDQHLVLRYIPVKRDAYLEIIKMRLADRTKKAIESIREVKKSKKYSFPLLTFFASCFSRIAENRRKSRTRKLLKKFAATVSNAADVSAIQEFYKKNIEDLKSLTDIPSALGLELDIAKLADAHSIKCIISLYHKYCNEPPLSSELFILMDTDDTAHLFELDDAIETPVDTPSVATRTST